MQRTTSICTVSVMFMLLSWSVTTRSGASDHSLGISVMGGGFAAPAGGGSSSDIQIAAVEYERAWKQGISLVAGGAIQKASSSSHGQKDEWQAFGIEAGMRFSPFRERLKNFHTGVTIGVWRGTWEGWRNDYSTANSPWIQEGKDTSFGNHLDLHAGYKFVLKHGYYLDPALHFGISGVSGHVSIPYAGVGLGAGIMW